MSLNVSFLSDSMWRRLDSTFRSVSYTDYDSVHFAPGCQIDKMAELAQKCCSQSDLIVINVGVNNLLNGFGLANCMYDYDQCYKTITAHCKNAHLAFVSLSYVANNMYTGTDNSAEMNPMIDELNCELQSYCDDHERADFVDLRTCLTGGRSGSRIARCNLARDGLHYSDCGIRRVACALVTKLCALKSTIVNTTQVPVSTDEFVVNNDDAWPTLPAPDLKARIHPASYPGQQYVTVSVAKGTGRVIAKSVEPVKTDPGNVSKSSVVTRKHAVKRYVQSVGKRHSCMSESVKQTCCRVVHNTQSDMKNLSFVHKNKFSVLYADDDDDDDDEHDDENQRNDVHVQCTRLVDRAVTLKKKHMYRDEYRTNVPYQNANVARNTLKVESPLFTNPYRVSNFSSLMWTKSCFIRNTVIDQTCCAKDVRRTRFVFETVPRLLQSLKLSVSDPLVFTLLQKYGVSLCTTNRVDNTESMKVFSNNDSLIDCMLKVLLCKTRPCNDTFTRVIYKTGKHLLKCSNVYGRQFISVIDSNSLHTISTNNFDIDLLLLCGDIESNPGPSNSRRQKQHTAASECQMQIATSDENTSHSDSASASFVEHMNTGVLSNLLPANLSYVDTESNCSTLRDCFGNDYVVVKMSGSGFCGFHCLSYSLTGNSSLYSQVIEDCINVFMNVPDLYRTRTNYGSRCNSSLTVSHYASFMRSAIQKVQLGHAIHSDAWCEDSHFAAISVLYDIVIFTYSTQHSQWSVFNEAGRRGYICMLSLPGHFDILSGIDGPPVVPLAANTHCVSRYTLNMSNVNMPIWQHLRRNYCFRFVHQFPQHYAGVNILNNPIAMIDTMTETVCCNREETERTKAVSSDEKHAMKCDFVGCTFSSNNAKSMNMHKMRSHGTRKAQRMNAQKGNKTLACDFLGCTYTAENINALNMHKMTCHKVTESSIDSSTNECLWQTVGRKKRSAVTVKTEDIESENQFIDSAESDVEPDDSMFVTSVEGQCSRRNNRIAGRETETVRDYQVSCCVGMTILRSPVTALETQVNDAVSSTEIHTMTCDVIGCTYTSSNRISIDMHKLRCHKKSRAQNNDTKKGNHRLACDFLGCSYNTESMKALGMHKRRCHTVAKSLTENSTNKTVWQTVGRTRSKKRSFVTVTVADEEPENHFIDCVETHVEPDNSLSVRNVESHCSRTAQHKNAHTLSCDFIGCRITAENINALNMHKMTYHKVTESLIQKSTNDSLLQTVVRKKRMAVPVKIKDQNAENNFMDCAETDVEPDDSMSVASIESHSSRRSKRIASRETTSVKDYEVSYCSPAKRGKYMCDVIDCGSVHDTARGLSIHKTKRHSKNVLNAADNANIEDDSVSITSVNSTSSGIRKSLRINNRNKPSTETKANHGTRGHAVINENEQFKTATRTIASDDFIPMLATNTRKGNLKKTFSQQIKDLEKEITPRQMTAPQVDLLYDELKAYHDALIKSVSNTTTEKLSSEVIEVILNLTVVDDCDRKFRWTSDDEKRLNELNKTCKLLQPRTQWTWAAGDDTAQGQYNDKRMQICIENECKWKIVECDDCGSTGLLVGDQTDSDICFDCIQLKRANEKERTKKQESWQKVKPISKEYPKTADGKDLPYLQPGDKAVISPIHAVVTIKKNHYADKRLRLESISLIQDPVPTWCKVLPRTSLADRYMVIERRVQNQKKYIVADADRVRQWLRYLFLHHKQFIELRRQNQLYISEAAIKSLGPDLELAEIDSAVTDNTASEERQIEAEAEDDGLIDATSTSGFAETHVFSFDRYPELYLKTKDVLRIRKEGKLEIVKDDTVRKPTYSSSANMAFPSLYAHGEMSPMDFGDFKICRYLLKKQTLFAHTMSDGNLQWSFAEDDIHMAHQYSRLSEQTVRATVGYYLSSHPSVAHIPLNSILTAFRDGVDTDSGLLDSHLPDLTTVMTQLPNSRQKWFAERLGIEAMSRDIGPPNVFVTINCDPRASSDVRRLLYKLEHGTDMDRHEPFMKDTAEFTRLINKFAPFVAIYLYRKVKAITRVFFTKICGVEEKEMKGDWKDQDVIDTSWYWGRAEFTETRGIVHFHFVVKLPHVLHTGILGRIIHNGRVVRQQLKCGNIKPDKVEQAWHLIKMGLLASRYAALFAHSISTASFYNEDVDIDGHDESKVICLEDYRKQFAENYRKGDITLNTHPIMRRFDDPECRSNICEEMAEVASVSCLHQCIRGSCGGDPMSGEGCRFDFPKKTLNHTVAAVMQINANQMEARILLRRTCDRVANLNRYLLRYLRSNHDVSVLIDSAHSLRYVTKYCSKAGKHAHLLDEMIEHLNKRSTDLLPPNMKQVLSHLLLADCSHRAFISKQELAYKVMNLPDVMRSFVNVDVVGFYKRANLRVPYDDHDTIEYSDRTEYSAYAERCREDTELGRGLTKEIIDNMCFNEFAETVQHKWKNSKKTETKLIDETTKRKFRSRDVSTGHWHLTLYRKRKHTRPSTVLYTAPAIDYELVEHGMTTTQTTFYDLSMDKRHQLYRAYYELVMYVPWSSSPDETFLCNDVRELLNDPERHMEIDSRHSLQRLEEFFKIYKQLYNNGEVAPPGSAWQGDNQFCYSIYLVNQHNREVHLDRVDNSGVLKAQYEDVDELVNVDVDIRPAVNDVCDLYEYPTFENFMPPDTFRDIMEQKAPERSEICVAFPMHNQWQRLEEVATHNTAKRFIASPPVSPVNYEDMTEIQKFAVDIGIDENHQILFLCGSAGSGKTATALKICEHFRGRVQATAYTGKAASLFNGPTIHSMFGWSHQQHNSTLTEMKPDSKKVTEFRVAHEDIELFVVEEALAVPPAYFALMDEMMTAAFNPKHKTNAIGEIAPFGGKKMLFLGDQAQLPPIAGPAVYDDGRDAGETLKNRRETKQSKRTKTGQLLFEKYLVPNCIYLQRLQRNSGLLGEICDRMRQGKLTEHDCTMLTYQRARFPDLCTDFGIHYQNEMCAMHNWRQLWNECKESTEHRRMYICKATYHVTNDNCQITDALSALPPQAYDYAPDILCVAEGCEVRLLQNVNIAAGLVTSQSGTVVRLIFNNADADLLLAGDHVAPYCIIVSFPRFQGFVDRKDGTDRRIFPYPNQPTWVPVFRRRFSVKISSLPSWIRKKQLEKNCYRIQFPLDLSSNITAHRAQGQTMDNCLVSVDLGLENPDMKMPPEISSLLYVACTRVTKLENLFVSPIHPSVWQRIGQNDADKHRRTVDEKLRKASSEFAEAHSKRDEMTDELAWTADSSKNGEEWRLLQQQKEPPVSNHHVAQHSTSNADFRVNVGNLEFTMFCRPVFSERHVGIDQGVKNFAIAVVEKDVGKSPNIVAATNYTDLQLKDGFKAADVLVALTQQTDLLSWMNPTYGDNTVDRVIVHVEQIDRRNRNSKQFSVELGRLLQQQVSDEADCIVQMSSPHMHRSNGPLFYLGDEIIEELQLHPTAYLQQRSKADSNPSVVNVHNTNDDDVEPPDVEPSRNTETDRSDMSESQIYRAKKKMSSDVFRYIMLADEEKLKQMKLTVDSSLQQHWSEIIESDKSVKLDDVGDALLHALDEILCGSSNFRQLVPASPSVHVNRTIAVAVFPEITYWVVLNCRWNAFVLENFGSLQSHLRNCYYKDPSTVSVIKDNMVQCSEVWSSLSEFEGNSSYAAVDHIKVVVKQLTGHTELRLKNIEAGALTQATTNAMKLICDGQMGVNSKQHVIRDPVLGSIYSRTSTVHRDRKFQVVLSTGKHTNAVLSCLSWMKHNLANFVEKRRESLNETEKTIFFRAVLNLARSGEHSMEMLQLSKAARTKLCSKRLTYQMESDKAFARNIADLVLVSMSKNQYHVKAVAANSRKTSKVSRSSTVREEADNVEQ